MDIDKAAPRGERARVEALVSGEEARIRRAFRHFLDTVRSAAVRRQVRLALEAGGVEAALRVVDAHVAVMGPAVAEAFQSAGRSEAAAAQRQLGGASVAVSFDPTYPSATEAVRASQLEFVREFTAAQREVTRDALVAAMRSGLGPVQTARAFRDSIGLTLSQSRAVDNYRRLLEAGDAAALQRDLRDRRFDRSVVRLLEDGDPLGPQRIARMVEQYRNRYLQYRAETIARTEALRAVNRARAEAQAQLQDRLGLPPSAFRRTWRSTRDSRVRDTHAVMDGQVRDAATPFQSPRGARLMFPGDTSLGAPAEEVVNCRCVLLTAIRVS